jgi:hypothetical protein
MWGFGGQTGALTERKKEAILFRSSFAAKGYCGCRVRSRALGGFLSRIWQALKGAQRQKSEGNGNGAVHAEVERRKLLRLPKKVPLLVYGMGPDRQPFHEVAETIDVNEGGTSLNLQTTVAPGQKLLLTNVSNQAERECRVAYVGKRVRGRLRVGVAFPEPAPEFWQPA